MARSNFRQFEREVRAMADAVPKEWLGKAARVGAFALQRVIENTQDSDAVDTGAMLAENVIEQDGRPIYEHPERPGPDQEFPSQKAIGQGPIFAPPSSRDALKAMKVELEVGGFGLRNRRFYAEWIENGSTKIEPRLIYARAADATAGFAASVAVEVPTERALRRNTRSGA